MTVAGWGRLDSAALARELGCGVGARPSQAVDLEWVLLAFSYGVLSLHAACGEAVLN